MNAADLNVANRTPRVRNVGSTAGTAIAFFWVSLIFRNS